MRAVLVAAIALAIPVLSPAQPRFSAAPLGVSRGMTPAQLVSRGGKAAPGKAGWYELGAAPTYALERTSVLAMPRTGACRVVGAVDVQGDGASARVRERFGALVERLTREYGRPARTVDRVKAGSLYEGADDFMVALWQGERELWTSWEDVPLPAGIQSIAVRAHGVNSSTARVAVTWDFDNVADCLAALEAQEGGGR